MRWSVRALASFLLNSRQRHLYGTPGRFAGSSLRHAWDLRRWGPLGEYIWLSRGIPGWMRGNEAVALARTCYELQENSIVVEIGSFLGCSTVLLGGARKLRNSGKVHTIDPFDASGDAFSVPVYRGIAGSLRGSLRNRFEENIRLAGLTEWVEVHQGLDIEIARDWNTPIDLLLMDGDQSVRGAEETYRCWSGHLKLGGVLAVHNSGPLADNTPEHGGLKRLVEQFIRPPQYSEIRLVASLTFARKMEE